MTTLGKEASIPYSIYMEMKDKVYGQLLDKMKKQLDLPAYNQNTSAKSKTISSSYFKVLPIAQHTIKRQNLDNVSVMSKQLYRTQSLNSIHKVSNVETNTSHNAISVISRNLQFSKANQKQESLDYDNYWKTVSTNDPVMFKRKGRGTDASSSNAQNRKSRVNPAKIRTKF